MRPDHLSLNRPDPSRNRPEGLAVNTLEHQLVSSRMQEMQAEALVASRARRLYLARRAARRAERAVRRAARASAAVY